MRRLFFPSLHQDGTFLTGSVPLSTRGETSWIRVADRYRAKAGGVLVAVPLSAGGLTLPGYTDAVSGLGSLGRYDSWAFLVAGKVGELAGVVRIGCSQQGGVDAVLLREARPDIGASWYPPPPNAAHAFDNAPLPPAVQAVTRAALAAAPVWQPRF